MTRNLSGIVGDTPRGNFEPTRRIGTFPLWTRAALHGLCSIAFFAFGVTASAQFKEAPPAPYPLATARQQIRTLLQKVDPGNRQQTIATLSGMLTWYRDILDEEMIAAWEADGRANLPDVLIALADARIATAVIEFSWHEQRQATFNLTYAPMLGNLMSRYSASARPFLDDLLGLSVSSQQPLELSQSEAEAVCRILLDMPDGTGHDNALKILPHYRRAAETLLNQDVRGADKEKKAKAESWLNILKANATAPVASGISPVQSPPDGWAMPAGQLTNPLGQIVNKTSASNQSPTPPAPVTAPANGVYQVGNGITPPRLVSKVDPEYSEIARKLGADGSVTLSIVVGQNGIARDIRVVRSLGWGLNEKAIQAVQKWKFSPGTNKGLPVDVSATVEVNFRVGDGVQEGYVWRPRLMVFASEGGLVQPEVTGGTRPQQAKELSDESSALEFTVTRTGTVKNDFRVIHGSQTAGELLARSLVTWKFRPAQEDGKPVEATGRVRFVKGNGDDDAKLPLTFGPSVQPVSSAPTVVSEKIDPPAPSVAAVTQPANTAAINLLQTVSGTLRRMAERDLILQTSAGKLIRFRLLMKTEFHNTDGKPVRDSLLRPGDHLSVDVSTDDAETALYVTLLTPGTASERDAASVPVEESRVIAPDTSDFRSGAREASPEIANQPASQLSPVAPTGTNKPSTAQVSYALLTRALAPNPPCTRPAPETEFLTTDPVVSVYFYLTGLQKGEKGTVEFRNPQGTVVLFREMGPYDWSTGCHYQSMPLAGQPASTMPGEWQVRVFWGGRDLASVPFKISPPMASALKLEGSTVLPRATAQVAYSYRFTVTGGTPPYRWHGGDSAAGLTLAEDGTLSGTLLRQSSVRIPFQVEDSAGNSLTGAVGLAVGAQNAH